MISRINHLWKTYGALAHILGWALAIFAAAVVWFSDVSSHESRIIMLENGQRGVDELRFNLKSLMERVGVRYIPVKE